jgi:hypothetical protein
MVPLYQCDGRQGTFKKAMFWIMSLLLLLLCNGGMTWSFPDPGADDDDDGDNDSGSYRWFGNIM